MICALLAVSLGLTLVAFRLLDATMQKELDRLTDQLQQQTTALEEVVKEHTKNG